MQVFKILWSGFYMGIIYQFYLILVNTDAKIPDKKIIVVGH